MQDDSKLIAAFGVGTLLQAVGSFVSNTEMVLRTVFLVLQIIIAVFAIALLWKTMRDKQKLDWKIRHDKQKLKGKS